MILITEHEVKNPEGEIILDAIATRFGYTGFTEIQKETDPILIDPVLVEEKPTQTKQEFLQSLILKYIFTEVASHLTATAGSDAIIAKQDEIETTIKPELEIITKPK